ncbi:MAG: maleylacetate reductase, partial [Solirubrobacteraceae bacterium]|nr:maleylacetate reductase [Solirubrobacteraceae bacterium]
GSSVIDTAKAVALALADDLHEPEDFVRRRAGGARALGPAVPIAALPSTLSGGEFTAVIASTDGDRVKHLLPDERLAPVSVLLDPLLAASTPRRLWLSTGVKTLSDAIERVCSLRATPLSDALCTRAIEWFLAALPASVDGDPDGAERLRCQLASWMALFALHEQGASVGLGAALRHQVAVTFEVAHGEATCSLLPHVLRFNLALLPERAARLALAMGVEAGDDGSGVIDRIDALLEELALPRRLSELTAASADLGALASRVLAEPAAQRNPRAASVEQVQAIIEAAW